ncbi:cardiolipin synthase [uncultured Oxalicibacterium sp.]|uniref:cardiolipin synthase n=1 Tax=uncultured Oxalicibacterium sp. TaxID=1168540 RepID=UPI0025DBD072|nr:cardiolipin synthase [uncultured Oxalicibacterium sp.]
MRTRIIWKDRSKKSKFLIILGSVVATLAVVLLFLNFSMGQKKVQEEIPRLYSIDDPQFERSMGALLGPAIVHGNRTQALINGEEIFPAMLEAIRGAQKSINFETYIYWSEAIGKEFAEAFAERARAGVKVHVLIDWVGSSKMEQSYLDIMEQAGVEVRKYHPLKWYNVARINNRTHRKLLVVDGKIGFTGGVGIAGQWTGNAQDPDHWRDSHYRVEGPVVAQMQAVAIDNWIKTTGEVLDGPDYFPPLEAVGDHHAQMFSSSPQGGSESMRLMYLMSMTAAQKTLHLSISYFVPDDMTRRVLIDAAKRGVKVQIIVPGEHMDVDVVRRSSRGMWGELLQAGIEIYEYEPTMYHCKVMIVDGLMVSVGSTNFDDRSFRLNDEANLNIYNAAFAAEQIKVFEDDLRHAHRITYEEWQNRPFSEKVHERIASWLGPLL